MGKPYDLSLPNLQDVMDEDSTTYSAYFSTPSTISSQNQNAFSRSHFPPFSPISPKDKDRFYLADSYGNSSLSPIPQSHSFTSFSANISSDSIPFHS